MDIDVTRAYRIIERHGFEGVGDKELYYIKNSVEKIIIERGKRRLEEKGKFKRKEEFYFNTEHIRGFRIYNCFKKDEVIKIKIIDVAKANFAEGIGRNFSKIPSWWPHHFYSDIGYRIQCHCEKKCTTIASSDQLKVGKISGY